MARYVTQQRKVLEAFLKSQLDKKLSVKDILNQIENKSISQSSIYRNLSILCNEGKLKRYVNEDSHEILYQYVADEACVNHIHLTCKNCGKIMHMSQSNTSYLVEHIKTDEDFYIDKGETIIYGICGLCRGKTK